MKFFFAFILIINAGLCYSQSSPRKVVDKETNSPVSYATVKVLHTPKGVIASEQGEFDLVINNTDSVLFSCAGYQTKILTGKEIDSIVYLTKKVKTLQEITVRNGKTIRTIVLGNGAEYLKQTIHCKTSRDQLKDECWPWGPGASAEFSERIDLAEPDLYYRINKIIIPVREKCKTSLLLHIYTVDSASGKPGEELLIKPVSIDNFTKYHKAVIDISTENITQHGARAFFVGFSWINGFKDGRCVQAILMKPTKRSNTYSRRLTNGDYSWFEFGKIMYTTTTSVSGLTTLFAVELDVMK